MGLEPENNKTMKGVLAQLKTFTSEGAVINSEIVFRPVCDWFIPDLHDYLGAIRYTDIGEVIDDFGISVAEKVIAGEVVEVTKEPSLRYRLDSCAERKFIKRSSKIKYPWPGATKEYLIGYLPEKLPGD